MHTVLWRERLWEFIPLSGVPAPRNQPRLSVTFDAYAGVDTVSFDV